MNITHILVPVDFSEGTSNAIQYALGLGEKFSARITLFHVLEPVTPPPEGIILTFNDFETACADEACGKLLELASSFPASVPVATDMTTGIPWDCIVACAAQAHMDLIVMPTHGRSGLKHLWLGSVAERVVRHAPCPVLVVRQTPGEEAANP